MTKVQLLLKEFELFWSEYPRKVAKKSAKQIWIKNKIGNGNFNVIMGALDKYKKTDQWQDKRFIPHPATWLNQERWEDEIDVLDKGEAIKSTATYFCRDCQLDHRHADDLFTKCKQKHIKRLREEPF